MNASFPIVSTVVKSALVNPLCLNASWPIALTFLKFTVPSAPHLENACFPTLSTQLASLPNVAEVRPLHPANALVPIVFVDSSETLVSPVQLTKASFPICSTLSRLTLVSFETPSKVLAPIFVTLSGSVTSSSCEYALKMQFPIPVIPDSTSSFTIESLY